MAIVAAVVWKVALVVGPVILTAGAVRSYVTVMFVDAAVPAPFFAVMVITLGPGVRPTDAVQEVLVTSWVPEVAASPQTTLCKPEIRVAPADPAKVTGEVFVAKLAPELV